MKALASLVAAGSAAAVTIAEINGNRFLSPLQNRRVSNVTGLVTAVARNGIYLRSVDPDHDAATSEGLFVYGSAVRTRVTVGDVVSLDGRVAEYRSKDDFLYTTELTEPAGLVVMSSGRRVVPLVVGKDTLPPPTADFSSLDEGGLFGVPNAVHRVSEADPPLDPAAYGLDFWESLMGELVTVRRAYQTSRPNKYGDVWVRGDWSVTGVNAHGGMTQRKGDANPETIVVGAPLDGSANPSDTKMGDYLGDVTGVIANAFGYYRLLPLTRISPRRTASAVYPAASLVSLRSCRGIAVADYNAENLAPDSPHMSAVVDQIVSKLRLPDLIFLQEVQDDSGIEQASGVVYDYAEVEPLDGRDGGEPGGNIRCAYLYRPDVVELHKPNPGGSMDANAVLAGPELKLNPGRIDPTNGAFDDSRKPLAAMWRTVSDASSVFFTVNVHFGSKRGSTTLHGDARPPINKDVEKRTRQAAITAEFIARILAEDPQARIIAAGDFNEFTQVQPMQVFSSKSGLVDMDEAAGVDPVERYTYLFDANSEALDHMYVSSALCDGARVEHLHLNTWQTLADQTSDHDPSLARLNVCGRGRPRNEREA